MALVTTTVIITRQEAHASWTDMKEEAFQYQNS